MPSATSRTTSGGVAGSWAPAMTSVGVPIPPSRSRTSKSPIAAQQAA
jgi:hypothetical protein